MTKVNKLLCKFLNLCPCVVTFPPWPQTGCVPVLCPVLDIMPYKLIKINGKREEAAELEKL